MLFVSPFLYTRARSTAVDTSTHDDQRVVLVTTPRQHLQIDFSKCSRLWELSRLHDELHLATLVR